MLVTFSPNHLTPPSRPRSIPTSTMKPSLSTPDCHHLLQHPYAFARVNNHTPFLDFFVTSCASPLVRTFPDPALGAGGRRHTVPPPLFPMQSGRCTYGRDALTWRHEGASENVLQEMEEEDAAPTAGKTVQGPHKWHLNVTF